MLFRGRMGYNGGSSEVLCGFQPEAGQLLHAFSVGVQTVHGGVAPIQPGDVGQPVSGGGRGGADGLVIGVKPVPHVAQLMGEGGVAEISGGQGAAGDVSLG